MCRSELSGANPAFFIFSPTSEHKSSISAIGSHPVTSPCAFCPLSFAYNVPLLVLCSPFNSTFLGLTHPSKPS